MPSSASAFKKNTSKKSSPKSLFLSSGFAEATAEDIAAAAAVQARRALSSTRPVASAAPRANLEVAPRANHIARVTRVGLQPARQHFGGDLDDQDGRARLGLIVRVNLLFVFILLEGKEGGERMVRGITPGSVAARKKERTIGLKKEMMSDDGGQRVNMIHNINTNEVSLGRQ